MSARLIPFAMFFLFVGFPILELALLITVGGWIGVWWTLAIVIGTAFLGTSLLRLQGTGVLQRATSAMEEGKMPVEPVMEGLFLMVAGAFLLTPGFVTDAIGLVLLVPPARITIAKFVLSRMVSGGAVSWRTGNSGSRGGWRGTGPARGRGPKGGRNTPFGNDVIEGDFERLDDDGDDLTGRQ